MQMLKITGVHYPDWKALADSPKDFRALRRALPEKSNLYTVLEKNNFASVEALSLHFRQTGGVFPEKLKRELVPAEAQMLENTLRVKWLKDVFALEPGVIHEVNTKYGELDWFLPESFAIYWAFMGIKHSPQRTDMDCHRMITQSLQVIFTNGRMLFVGKTPNMDFLLVCTYEENGENPELLVYKKR